MIAGYIIGRSVIDGFMTDGCVKCLCYRVKPFSKDNILTAGYARPSWDGSKPGIFYVNPSSLTTTSVEFIVGAGPSHGRFLSHIL